MDTEITIKVTKKHIKWLKCLVPIATLWGLAIFHEAFGLSLSVKQWYAFPLTATYIAIFAGSIYLGLNDLINS